ncbi:MAG: hypothetical protein HZB61_12945 [Nitrospirae bacterium]|nr:hypothetical protein [Nitrospirota bacterium]
MAKIKIKDLPKDKKVSKEELKKVFGGATWSIMQTYSVWEANRKVLLYPENWL